MLEDANKRLIDMQDEQLKVNRALLETLSRLANQEQVASLPDTSAIDEFAELMRRKAEELSHISMSHSLGHGTNGHHEARPKTASDKVRNYFLENPSTINLPVRELEKLIGVGKSTISRVINESNDISTNGNNRP